MNGTEQTPEVEARGMGWRPLEEFKGDPERWVDAETFAERGRAVMPILKANNAKLEAETAKLRSETIRLQELFRASQEAIGELQKVHTANTKAAVENARKDLLQALKTAKNEGDVDREVEINDELANLRAVQQEAPKPAAAAAPPPNDAVHPDFAAWQAENSWFGTDNRRTMRAMGIAQELRSDPEYDEVVGKQFFAKVLDIMDERTGNPRTSKVGGSRPSGAGAGGGNTYASLTSEERAACDSQAKKLVGEGRAFKDTKSWQAYYVKTLRGE